MSKCKECKWWKRITNLNLREDSPIHRWTPGRCYRYPQTAEKRANEICGEFSLKPQEPK